LSDKDPWHSVVHGISIHLGSLTVSNVDNERVGDEDEKGNELNWDCSSLEKNSALLQSG